MQQLVKGSLILLQLFVVLWTNAAEKPQPYCYKNVTETSYKLVTKTRLKNVASKNFFRKLTFKKDTTVEVYEEEEPVYKIKVERSCCEGYKLSELDLCEPQCVQSGCPAHSICVEPEVCECLKGYFSIRSVHDGKHYCEPICEKPCPENGACVAPNECGCTKGYHVTPDMQCRPYCVSGCPHEGVCVAPNTCSCQDGYKSLRGSCWPICSLGDQCQNGKCIEKDRCICNAGFRWDSDTLKCVWDELQSTTSYPDLTGAQEATNSIMEVETDIETSRNDVDPSQVFDEDTTTFYVTDEYDSSTTAHLEKRRKCPDDFVFHRGECRPLKFVSNELDCWLNPCPYEHALCLENGTCTCSDGYKLFLAPDLNNQNSSSECLTETEYDAKLRHLKKESLKHPTEETINWTMVFFIVLGVSIMLSALIFLGIKLLTKQKGATIDVEGKNLACAYDNRDGKETAKSVY